MRAKSEALARQFEAKVQDALATLERLGDADWDKTTEAEQWSVGVTAHHLAGVLEPISDMVKAVAAGRSPGRFTGAMFDAMNAQHAREHARCTKAETIGLLKKGAAVAVGVIRGLSDDQLAKSATVLTEAPPMSAEELITGALLAHIDEHFGSIRKTVGHD
jgi:Mycothiol maleylpyruvate isomerase N-terminal domain